MLLFVLTLSVLADGSPPPVTTNYGIDPARDHRPEKPRPVLKADALKQFLQARCPKGLIAAQPEAVAAGVAGLASTQARIECRRGEQGLIVSITDATRSPTVLQSVRKLAKIQRLPKRYAAPKGTAVAYTYNPNAKRGRIDLVWQQFLISVAGSDVSEEELVAGISMFDAERISVYKPRDDDWLESP